MTAEAFPRLAAFLESRLPELGLDYDTYGPYVIGMEVNLQDADGDGISEEDAETIDGVMQLLQASSESHSDDEQVWKDLCAAVIEHMQKDLDAERQQHDEEVQRKKAELEAQLEKAKLEEREQPTKADQKKTSVDDAAKKALLQRFAYEQDGEDEEEGDEPVQTNKDAAAAANLERARELRSKKVQTKKEEQQKTKENRKNKEQLKEERKKRAVKGERKR